MFSVLEPTALNKRFLTPDTSNCAVMSAVVFLKAIASSCGIVVDSTNDEGSLRDARGEARWSTQSVIAKLKSEHGALWCIHEKVDP